MIERKIVKGLPSSFVAANMKLEADRGAGEAKLWVGQMSNAVELDRFFAFDQDYLYTFSKENLLEYLNQVKVEYVYQKFNIYKNASLGTWNENYSQIKALTERDLVVHLTKFTDTTRYYVRAEEDVFKKVFRKIAVPKLTNVVFAKDTEKKTIILSLELNLEYEKASVENSINLREEFEVFITDVLRLKSTRQVGDLGNLSQMLVDAGVLEKDVYNIADVDEYRETVKKIKDSKEYQDDKESKKEKSPKSGLAYDQGLTNYDRFLVYLNDNEVSDGLRYITGINIKMPRNRIVFGAPGTGKSFKLNKDRKALLDADNETDYERVTFHPDYSYANFVGTYKPVMVSGEKYTALDEDRKYVLSILNDESKTGQEKYDELFERFKDEGLTRLPLLLGLYTDESFETKKKDGSPAVDSSVEKNHGRAIRKYVNLITGIEKTKDIAYEYVPGPFMRVLVKALKNARTDNPKPYLLLIEEINRANVAAVFGDVFQLLDRGDDDCSEYPIEATEDMKKYLSKELDMPEECFNKIRIPDNMFIWATMNSADQGVFPMDTAFKRRWDFTYIGIDENDKDLIGKTVVLGSKSKQRVEWNALRKAINDYLANQKINEDKQLGPYFIGKKIVVPDGDEIDSEEFAKVFKNKVIMYLFEDAAKQKRSSLFEGCFQNSNRYSEICKEFDEKGIGIFNREIQLKANLEDIESSTNTEENEA